MARCLVVADRSASGRTLATRVGPLLGDDTAVHLLVPAGPLRPGEREFVRSELVGPALSEQGESVTFAHWRLREGLLCLAEAGFEVTGEVCDANPWRAVRRMLVEERFDRALVTEAASPISRRLRVDLASRLTRQARIPVLQTASAPVGRTPAGPRAT